MVRFCILCKGSHLLCLLSWSSLWSLLGTLYYPTVCLLLNFSFNETLEWLNAGFPYVIKNCAQENEHFNLQKYITNIMPIARYRNSARTKKNCFLQQTRWKSGKKHPFLVKVYKFTAGPESIIWYKLLPTSYI